jgi:hypothetical protein
MSQEKAPAEISRGFLFWRSKRNRGVSIGEHLALRPESLGYILITRKALLHIAFCIYPLGVAAESLENDLMVY